MEKYRPILKFFSNRYVVVILFTFVWMLFFDRNNIPSQLKLHAKISQLEEDRDFYLAEKERIEDRKNLIFNDPGELERFAREKFFMKKSNEDVFIISEK